ncbi:hypothetical protein V6N11_072774 [Hibiscus sabdariffa]|uniref:Uncharacterized protein n=2 Tax=Hibiscus sabdariffa TaxID=183260 RepID=A0ABR2NE35_9ROSI
MDLSVPTGYFICGNVECSEIFGGLFSYYKGTRCICEWGANRDLGKSIKIDAVKDETEGVLYRGESMFFITDDFGVMQGSPEDLIKFLLNMRFKNVCRVEEKVVKIGSKEITGLLIHSLFSNTTFTDVFLKKQGIGSSTTPMFDELFSSIAPKEKESTEKDGKTRVKLMLRKLDRKGYVENSFVVTDDLVVQPRCSVSSISLLLEMGIQLDDVESKVISIGEVESIALLGACLWASSALSASLNSFGKTPKQEPF